MDNSNSINILIVDDSETNRMLLQYTLEELGFEVSEAADGEKAVEMALEGDYVAVFMDINMPRMNGLEALAMLKQLHYASPVIACSAEENFDTIEGFLNKGFTDFVPKPIEPEVIKNTLSKRQISSKPLDSALERKHYEKVQELSNRFVKNLPAIINKLDSAIKYEDAEKLRRLSHKLKANAGQYGFKQISKVSKDIDSAIVKSRMDIALEKAHFLLFELHKLNDRQAKSN